MKKPLDNWIVALTVASVACGVLSVYFRDEHSPYFYPLSMVTAGLFVLLVLLDLISALTTKETGIRGVAIRWSEYPIFFVFRILGSMFIGLVAIRWLVSGW
ncbi:hypothetical protein [Chitiniphilus shinanonensis]|uniref:hypothetical protein n=1 Tax=Chitiniphilus shinanonensis TaxID=553088 RepID=UPI0030556FF8